MSSISTFSAADFDFLPSSSLSVDLSPGFRTSTYALEATSTLVGTEERERDFRHRIAAIQGYLELPRNWDRYGGKAAEDHVVEFAVNLVNEIRITPGIPAPLVRPISGGVYLEWRSGDTLLYFEADEESVLRYSQNVFGEETAEDANFDFEKAYQVVVDFHESAA